MVILWCYEFEDGEVYRLYNAALAPADVKLLESVHGKCRKWIEKQ